MLNARLRYSASVLLFIASAAIITGTVAVNPWFPLPATLITDLVHPAILASTAAAVVPAALFAILSHISFNLLSWNIALPT